MKGVRFVATDLATYQPVAAPVAFLVEAVAVHGTQITFSAHLDALAGTDQLRTNLLAGKSMAELTSSWNAQLSTFRQQRAPYLLYPD